MRRRRLWRFERPSARQTPGRAVLAALYCAGPCIARRWRVPHGGAPPGIFLGPRRADARPYRRNNTYRVRNRPHRQCRRPITANAPPIVVSTGKPFAIARSGVRRVPARGWGAMQYPTRASRSSNTLVAPPTGTLGVPLPCKLPDRRIALA